jgi:hypothetical protein
MNAIGRHDPVGARSLEQVRDQPRRDRLAALVLLVLARVRVERHHHGDPLRARPLERVHHDQLLHHVLVDGRGVRLDDEGVGAADGLLEPDEQLAVGERVRRLRGDRHVEVLGDLFGELPVRPSGEEHQVLLRRT